MPSNYAGLDVQIFVTVDLINAYSDYRSGVDSPATKSSLIVSRAASSVSSSWAIPVSRLLRSIEGLRPPIPERETDSRTTAQQDSVTKAAQQEPENTTAQPLEISRGRRKTTCLMTSRPIGIPTATIVVAVLPLPTEGTCEASS